MIRTSIDKTCVLCGEDCSCKARVRDDYGNYYCKTCHQAALARRRARNHEADHASTPCAAPRPATDVEHELQLDPGLSRTSKAVRPRPTLIDDDEDAPLPIDDD